jgi:hypothetical protein
MSNRRNWVLPREELPSFLKLLEEKIQSTTITLEHRDSLIRLRAILETDLMRAPFPQHHTAVPGPRDDCDGRAKGVVLRDPLEDCPRP